MTNAINRRAFLRSAASASAVASGAGAVTIAAAGGHPDAELIALGVRFDRVIAKLRPAREAMEAARVGFNRTWTGPRGQECLDAFKAHAGALEDRHDRLFDLMDAIAGRICMSCGWPLANRAPVPGEPHDSIAPHSRADFRCGDRTMSEAVQPGPSATHPIHLVATAGAKAETIPLEDLFALVDAGLLPISEAEERFVLSLLAPTKA